VKRIDAPAVVVLMVTVCAEVYVPAAGVKDGFATVPVIVYAADMTALLFQLVS
jgi:hypothetical protein